MIRIRTVRVSLAGEDLGTFEINRNPASDPMPRCRCTFTPVTDQTPIRWGVLVLPRPFDWRRDCPAGDVERLFPPVVGRGRGYIMFGPHRLAPWTRSEIVRWIADRPLRSRSLHGSRNQSYRRGPHPPEGEE